jgi:hypothetical protein
MLRQAVEAVDFLQIEEEQKRNIINETMQLLIDVDMNLTASEIAAIVHQNIIQCAAGRDPYETVKKESLRKAFEWYAYAKDLIKNSTQPLATALKLCVAGNVIDFGPNSTFDLHETIETVLNEPFAEFACEEFQRALQEAHSILFLADNAGETVFDRLLIEEMQHPLTYVVKKDIILNDATWLDAQQTEFPDYVTIVDNGSAIQGTVLSRCSKEFVASFAAADMVISKGMANFETLTEEGKRTFFLLKIKCPYVAKISGIPTGSFVLRQGGMLEQLQ